jgi:hypothetical protein
MTSYVLLLLLTSIVAVSIVALFRAFSNWKSSDAKTVVLSRGSLREGSMMSLSSGRGQWSVGHQQGFFDTTIRVRPTHSNGLSRSGSAGKTKAQSRPGSQRITNQSTVRKPWGW